MARANQAHLPGMAPKRDKALHDAAIAYDEANTTYKTAKLAREAALDGLVPLMEKRKLTVYHFDEVTIELVPETKVKVKIARADEGEESEEG